MRLKRAIAVNISPHISRCSTPQPFFLTHQSNRCLYLAADFLLTHNHPSPILSSSQSEFLSICIKKGGNGDEYSSEMAFHAVTTGDHLSFGRVILCFLVCLVDG